MKLLHLSLRYLAQNGTPLAKMNQEPLEHAYFEYWLALGETLFMPDSSSSKLMHDIPKSRIWTKVEFTVSSSCTSKSSATYWYLDANLYQLKGQNVHLQMCLRFSNSKCRANRWKLAWIFANQLCLREDYYFQITNWQLSLFTMIFIENVAQNFIFVNIELIKTSNLLCGVKRFPEKHYSERCI